MIGALLAAGSVGAAVGYLVRRAVDRRSRRGGMVDFTGHKLRKGFGLDA